MRTLPNRAALLLLVGLMSANAALAAPAACNATSGVSVPTVVELYTSEGCNSCPPADKWLSTIKDQPGVVSLAFHVDYWDRLGWKDRFADPAYTQRQNEVSARGGILCPARCELLRVRHEQPRFHARWITPTPRRASSDPARDRNGQRSTPDVLRRCPRLDRAR